jgi:hypothetical protein
MGWAHARRCFSKNKKFMITKPLSPSIIKNTVMKWAKFAEKSKDYQWTKHDSNAFFLLQVYVDDCNKEAYQKAKERNQELDSYLEENFMGDTKKL